MIKDFYKGKRVLITGHTGFKGSWLTLILSELGADVCGISLAPNTSEDFFVVNQIEDICESNFHDIADFKYVNEKINEFQPDIIFHLAAQALVRYSYANPLETYQTNLMGSASILDGVKNLDKPCAIVIITTDKVYENKEWHYPYRETDRLGGLDPYSSSKACAELVVSSYRNSYFNIKNIKSHKKAIASARAGNVIGGGDWSENRLLPDIIRFIRKGHEIIIRNPEAVRPWQHVFEPLYGYLLLAVNLYQQPTYFSGAWNFGPYPNEVLKVEEVVKLAINKLGKGTYRVERELNAPHEAMLLKLDISKTVNNLAWKPCLTTKEAIEWTLDWYDEYLSNGNSNLKDFSIKSIKEFFNRIENENCNHRG